MKDRTDTTGALLDFTPGRIAQLDFVKTYQPGIVTVGVGGNDAGLMQKVRACVSLNTCDWAKPDQREKTALEIKALYPRFIQLYEALKSGAPAAKKYVIGYPDVLMVARECGGVTGLMLNADERDYLDRTIKYLNRVIAAAASTAGVRYISLDSAFGEHALCKQGENAAMNAIRLGDDGAVFDVLPDLKVVGSESFHPTPFGHQLMAAAIRGQTNGFLGDGCADCSLVVAPEPDEYWNVSPVAPTRSALVEMTPSNVSADQTSLPVSLDTTPFRPGDTVSVTIPSQVSLEKTLIVGADSKIRDTVELASPLTAGVHTIFMSGVGLDGERLALYQEIVVAAKKVVIGAQQVPLQKGADTSVYRAVSVTKETHEKATSPILRAVQAARVELASYDLIIIIAAAIGMTGIIVTCLLLVRLSKK